MSSAAQAQEKFAAQADKMLGLKLAQLKKLAKKNFIPDDVIEAACAADEEDAKGVLVSLIFKAACLKAAPSPMRTRPPPEEQDLDEMFCTLCEGCIRVPGHEGPCVDQQCNEICPKCEDSFDDAKVWAVEEEVARHKAVKQEIEEKLDAERKAAAAARRQRRLEEEAQRKAEEEEAKRKIAEEEELRRLAEEEAARRLAEEEMARKREEEVTRQKLEEEKEAARELERARRRAEEQAEMAAMDKLCVETFLECVKPCAWRDRVRTPLKGTNLYTKVMRPCRPAGTSVDVKDSSFRTLGNFLQWLEKEGLIRLKPGESDPVVTQIKVDACSMYVYRPASAEGSPSGSTGGMKTKLPEFSWQ